MMTFKQYLREEEEEADMEHSIEDAALAFIEHCRQFPDIDHPLYRLSGESWMRNPRHKLRTRVPRDRNRASIGGTAKHQEYLFSLPGWKGYPARRRSIFCSTTKNFDMDVPADNGQNLLMIYPFDGVEIAVLPASDLNTMDITRGLSKSPGLTLQNIFEPVNRAYTVFDNTSFDTASRDPRERIELIKKHFNNGGKFDPEANGNDELADEYAALSRDSDFRAAIKALELVATEYPERLSPDAMGAKLVTSADLDLPGKTREVWFSGKYLSVPARYFEEFKRTVEDLS